MRRFFHRVGFGLLGFGLAASLAGSPVAQAIAPTTPLQTPESQVAELLLAAVADGPIRLSAPLTAAAALQHLTATGRADLALRLAQRFEAPLDALPDWIGHDAVLALDGAYTAARLASDGLEAGLAHLRRRAAGRWEESDPVRLPGWMAVLRAAADAGRQESVDQVLAVLSVRPEAWIAACTEAQHRLFRRNPEAGRQFFARHERAILTLMTTHNGPVATAALATALQGFVQANRTPDIPALLRLAPEPHGTAFDAAIPALVANLPASALQQLWEHAPQGSGWPDFAKTLQALATRPATAPLPLTLALPHQATLAAIWLPVAQPQADPAAAIAILQGLRRREVLLACQEADFAEQFRHQEAACRGRLLLALTEAAIQAGRPGLALTLTEAAAHQFRSGGSKALAGPLLAQVAESLCATRRPDPTVDAPRGQALAARLLRLERQPDPASLRHGLQERLAATVALALGNPAARLEPALTRLGEEFRNRPRPGGASTFRDPESAGRLACALALGNRTAEAVRFLRMVADLTPPSGEPLAVWVIRQIADPRAAHALATALADPAALAAAHEQEARLWLRQGDSASARTALAEMPPARRHALLLEALANP